MVAAHHHALLHWIEAARDGRIPEVPVSVVHLDAHPDLAVPAEALPPGHERDPAAVVRRTDIASFQIAAAWLGLVRHVIWLRPEAARQLPDGPRRFRVGLDRERRLRVDDPSDYYVLDDGWSPTSALAESMPLTVDVVPLAEAARGGVAAPAPVILDVDLDAFATRNPAAERLRAAGLTHAELETLRAMFAPERLRLPEDPRARIAQVEEITSSLGVLAAGPLWQAPGAVVRLLRAGLTPGDLLALYRMVSRAPDSEAWDVLLEDGRTLVGLPEYPDVSPERIAATALRLRDAVARSRWRPVLVTVARSVNDGYTPAARWPEIEWATLLALRDVLGPVPVRYDRGLSPAPRIAPGSPAIAPFLPPHPAPAGVPPP